MAVSRRTVPTDSNKTSLITIHYEDSYAGDRVYLHPRGRLVAVLDGVRIGDAGFLRYPREVDMVSLEHVVIEPEFQRRGIGKLLVSEFKRYVNKTAPGIKYARAEFASRASLRMVIAVLGAPFVLDNDIRCLSLEEAERALPVVSKTSTRGGVTSVESGAPVGGVFWVGKGRRPKVSPFRCD